MGESNIEVSPDPLPLLVINRDSVGENFISVTFQPPAGVKFDSVELTIARADAPEEIIQTVTVYAIIHLY